MRIIAGKFRGRRLRPADKLPLRPTSDRLRETLFDILAAARGLEDSLWLDLFAGSGAVGLEALSRGARKAVLVEQARGALALMRKNIADLELDPASVEVFATPALEAISRLGSLSKQGQKNSFDYVFLDPPYDQEKQYGLVLAALAASDVLAGDSLVIAEHSKRFAPPTPVGRLHRYRLLRQGDAALSFYRLGD